MIEHVLYTPRGALWAGMGTGKTGATLTAIDALQLAGELTKPALILAPLRVANSVWPDEAAKWEHLSGMDVQPITGDMKTRQAALRRVLRGNVGVATVNYENLPWLMEELGWTARSQGEWPFGMVVPDESTRLKGFRLRQGTQRAKALGRVAHSRPGRWMNLTGTPAPNGLIDLWGQTWFLDAGERLGRTFDAFKDRWFQQVPGGDGYATLRPLAFAQADVEAKLADLCLSVQVPVDKPIVNVIKVDLPTKARELYRDMEKRMFMEIEGHEIEAFGAAARTMKCLQLANGAVYVDDRGNWAGVHDAKLQALESVIEEAAGMPVLVAYHFKSDLARILKAFPWARKLDDDPQTIRDWNAGRIRMLLAHPKSAGHGLNLQDGGNILVFFGQWWDLEEHDQIIERIGPMRQKQSGHDRPVYLHYILVADSVDEIVMERRESKRDVQDLLMEAMRRRT